jgi:hypothetical protein
MVVGIEPCHFKATRNVVNGKSMCGIFAEATKYGVRDA